MHVNWQTSKYTLDHKGNILLDETGNIFKQLLIIILLEFLHKDHMLLVA